MKAASTPRALRCAIYTRKSSEEGLEQGFNSLHAQREACEAYVLSQAGEGWQALPTLYDDGGFSGGSMERPALKRLLEDVGRGLIDVVVVYKVDRLTRALADFAKIVERFDAEGVSFVSVTQAFNTTTSMGRLTLNVLLSFAQFEREVTGERIRDKLAASKKKGMWMGGVPPLGYAPDGRSLRIVEEEAETVRHIFERYLALGTVLGLRDELAAEGVVSKLHTFNDGRQKGGVPMNRGMLYHLLSNRIYVGEITHRDESYPGLHAAIVDPAVFTAVQDKLAANARRKESTIPDAGRNARTTPVAFLAGLVRDDAGSPMSPSHTAKATSVRYRYYVSASAQRGAKAAASNASLVRCPAGPLEDLVLDRARRLVLLRPGEDERSAIRARLHQVVVGRRRVSLHWRMDPVASEVDETCLPQSDTLRLTRDHLVLDVAVRIQRRGGSCASRGPGGGGAIVTGQQDRALVTALVRAEGWRRDLLKGAAPTIDALAQKDGVQKGYARRMLRLAFLAPDLKTAILDGRTPDGLSLQRVMTEGLPDSWAEQRRWLAAA